MNHLYLVRHGENVANLTKEFSCNKVDYSLTAKGLLQARQTAVYLRSLHIDEVYCSPLKRAMETAQIIGDELGLPVVVLEDLREINVGDLEGRPANAADWKFHNEILEKWFDGQPQVTFPGGENGVMAWRRARRAVEYMCAGKSDRNIVAVGHGGLFTWTLLELCSSVDVNWLRHRDSANCSVSDIMVRSTNGRLDCDLVTWAEYGHLSGEAAALVRGIPDDSDWQK